MTDLLLIHGWGFDSRVWSPLADRLADHCRVRLLSLPGYGEAFDPASLPSGTVLCGWSQGALVAMQLAHAHPDRIARLILVGATPRFVASSDWPHAQASSLLEAFTAGVHSRTAATLKRFAGLVSHGDADARTAMRHLQALIDAHCPATDTLLAGLADLGRTDLRGLVGTLRQPTLLLHGEYDALMPLSAAHWLADRLPAARLFALPGRGHAPFLTATDTCAERMLDFVNG
jgi:pimeloyl-[acyl-carrier protein] methyl ester esterase